MIFSVIGSPPIYMSLLLLLSNRILKNMSKKINIKFNDKTKNLVVDVDCVIDKYNANNPDKEKLTRTKLAKIMDVNKQVFVNWKGGATPKVIYMLFKLMELGECTLEDFIVKS